LAQILCVDTKYHGKSDHVTKNAIYTKFKMAAAAILDFIKVPFLGRLWAGSHKFWCAGAECHPELKSVAKISI